MDPNYNINVFINCPYDNVYQPLKRALIFSVRRCGFIPLLVSMDQDSGMPRIEKIKKMISISRYGIHDISRCKSNKKNEWYRMNMPFEMGMDFGCRTFSEPYSDKKYLVLTKEPYSMQPSLSDLSGNDPKCHKEEVELLMKIVRDFLYNQVDQERKTTFPQKQTLIDNFLSFQTFLYSNKISENEIKEMTDDEYCSKVDEFIKDI